MPVYDYKCSKCSTSIEFNRGFGEDREPLCCGETMVRQWSAPGVIFKGTGFYTTDSKGK